MTDYDLSKMPESVRRQYEKSQAMLDANVKAEQERRNPQEAEPEPQDQTPPSVEDQPKREEEPVKPQQDEWQHRYQVLQGKYNAEVPRLHQTIKTMEAQLKSLADEMERVKAERNAEPQGAFKDLMNVFGEEDPQVKFAREQQERLARLEAELSKMTQNVTQVAESQAQTAEDRFYAGLDRADPDWQTTNVDPGLMLWLAELDPLWGTTRKEVFDDAVARLDSSRVAAFFAEYKRQTAKPVQKHPKPSDKLKTQVTPATGSGTGGAPESVVAPTWTRAEVKAFFEDRIHGRFKGTEEDANRIQRDILEANAQGRIVG